MTAFALPCAFALSAAVQASAAPLRYEVALADPASERFEVALEIPEPGADTLVFYMPIWAPGAYQPVYYGRWVRNLRAEDERGRALPVAREGEPGNPEAGAPDDSWRIATRGARTVTVRYEVEDIEIGDVNGLWFELSDVTRDEAFFSGTAVFGYPAGAKDRPYEVCVRAPAGWTVVVPLPAASRPGCARAENYDALADTPVFLGATLVVREFREAGRPFRVAVSPAGPYEPDSLVAVARDVVRAGIDFWRDAPFPDGYTFLVELADPYDLAAFARYGDSYGALEHTRASVYLLPQVPPVATREFFFLPQVFAHEFAHVWSPKRIHSDRLGPFDYQAPVETETLWFAEGVTDYLAYVWLARYGIVERWRVFDEMAGLADRVLATPGVWAEPIAGLSRRLPSAESVDEILPLYTKGTLLGFWLDVYLRSASGNRVGLDHVLRALEARYGRTGRGFPDDSLVAILEELSGVPLREFAGRYIYGSDPLPLEDAFRRAGLAFARDTVREPSFGAALAVDDANRLVIAEVTSPDGLARLGVQAGDVLARWDGRPVPLDSARAVFEAFAETYDPERTYVVEVLRDGRPVRLEGKIPFRTRVRPVLRPDPDADAATRGIRAAIFGDDGSEGR